MRKSKEYKGTQIIAEYDSTNIQGATYDINSKKLQIKFGSGALYEYDEVPHEIFSAFDNAESQGKYFNQNISKKFNYKKVETLKG
jgi:hypothetical protein